MKDYGSANDAILALKLNDSIVKAELCLIGLQHYVPKVADVPLILAWTTVILAGRVVVSAGGIAVAARKYAVVVDMEAVLLSFVQSALGKG